MIERYIQFLGLEQTTKYLKANERPLTPSIRTNTLKISSIDLKQRLENKGFKLEPIEWIPYGFNVLKTPYNLGSSHEFLQGYYYLQNVASMIPARILNPMPSDIVIDMCAAPGGKATHLAQIMNNKGILILIERNQKRIPALEINLLRMGVINSIIVNDDAANLPNMNIKADKILLDAPCTGEGLIRQDSSRKKSKRIKDINKMSAIQRHLLESGLKSLKTGGELLYSTCSIGPEENEIVVNDILNSLSEYKISELPHDYGENGFTEIYGKSLRDDLKYSKRIYPHIHDTIGFYLCLIKKYQ
jgi:NOL1/NOP2/sun family putative RNA methylase